MGFLAAWRAFQKQQRLSEMKSNFVSSVSHELRAPIASVRLIGEGWSGADSGAAKAERYFRFIVQECRRLSSLIENVLDFSRIEQGRKQYELEADGPRRAGSANGQASWSRMRREGGRLETFQHPTSTSNLELEVGRTRRFNRRW